MDYSDIAVIDHCIITNYKINYIINFNSRSNCQSEFVEVDSELAVSWPRGTADVGITNVL